MDGIQNQMNEYKINASMIEYYLSFTVKAHNKDRASDIAVDMINNGDIPVVKSDLDQLDVKEIK